MSATKVSLIIELAQEIIARLQVDVRYQAETERQGLVVVQTDDVGVVLLLAARVALERETVEVQFAARPLAEQIPELEGPAHAARRVVVRVERRIHVAGDGPVEDGHLLDAEDGVPHLDIVVLLEVRPARGELPARHRLAAGRDLGLEELVKVLVLLIEGSGVVEDRGLDHAVGLLHPPLLCLEVDENLLGAQRLVRELDRDVARGDAVLRLGVDLDPVGEEPEVLVADLDVPDKEDAVLGLFLIISENARSSYFAGSFTSPITSPWYFFPESSM